MIPAVPPSMNRFAGRTNSWEYRKAKEQWTGLVKALSRSQRPPAPYDKAVVTIEYRFPDRRRRDPDNYCGKLLLDGLTAAGVIADDSFQHIELVLRASPDPGSARTTITVEHQK